MHPPQPATLQDVLITPLLAERPVPPRDIAAEHHALVDLVGQAATEPSGLLPRLVDLAVRLCDAGSAGVSLLGAGSQGGDGLFHWVAMSGAYREYVGGTTPEHFSPCGVCLSRGTAQLYRYPARLFTYLAGAQPPIVEGLVLPLRADGGQLGTIWIVSHDESRRFTAGDVAVMASLADFTSAALVMQGARAEAEAASRAKDEFLAVVSHELRRPLTAIVGWSELLLAGRSTPATAARAIEALYENARRQQEMIEDLLDASRSLTGTLRLNERPVDLTGVVQSTVEIAVESARQRGIELTADLGTSVAFQGDPERLQQIVGNLLSNAVKFTPRGGRVSVALRRSDSGVDISVTDTGIGIAPKMLPQVFEAFCKADASSTRRESGLGLGLTIARRLTALHDGTIEAHSAGLGTGARFTVRLPATRIRPEPDLRSQPAPVQKRSLKLAGLTVLVVDDEQDVREIIGCVLEEAGARVVAAADVESALSALASHRIDVLVTDLVMPGRDGYDLLAGIVRDSSLVRPRKAIAVTALASVRERLRALAAGFDHHMAKPVDFNALVQAIVEPPTYQEAR